MRLGGTCLNPIWTDRGNGPAAAGSARYLQFLLADGIRDAATAQVTVTADQDSVRAAQDQQCSSSAAERCSRSAAAASPNNYEVANSKLGALGFEVTFCRIPGPEPDGTGQTQAA